jgi:hypothetical protein
MAKQPTRRTQLSQPLSDASQEPQTAAIRRAAKGIAALHTAARYRMTLPNASDCHLYHTSPSPPNGGTAAESRSPDCKTAH